MTCSSPDADSLTPKECLGLGSAIVGGFSATRQVKRYRLGARSVGACQRGNMGDSFVVIAYEPLSMLFVQISAGMVERCVRRGCCNSLACFGH